MSKLVAQLLRRREAPEEVASRRPCPVCDGPMRYVVLSRRARLYRRVCNACGYVDQIPVKLRNQQPLASEAKSGDSSSEP